MLSNFLEDYDLGLKKIFNPPFYWTYYWQLLDRLIVGIVYLNL